MLVYIYYIAYTCFLSYLESTDRLVYVCQVLNRNMDPRGDPRTGPGTEFAVLAVPSFHSLLPTQLITAGKRRDCVRLRGLPYEASVNDIVTFLGDHSRQIVTQGVHLIYSAEVRTTVSK